jgi:ABC-type branched-subunit amino acid transport system substrate-binding protein
MRAGLELWARDAGRELVVLNDDSRAQTAAQAHEQLVDLGCNPVLGPYGSDTTRAVALARAGEIVWNHGAAADDVQRLPGVVSMPAPASRYLVALARAAIRLGASRFGVVTARGTFARLAREGLEREAPVLGVELVADLDDADCVLLCGPVEWEAQRFRELKRGGVLFGGVSPGLPEAPRAWPDGTLAPVQWHPDLGGPPGLEDYVAAQAYAAALIAERCLQLEPADPLSAARTLSTDTFFGRFELDETGLQTGHELSVVQWRRGRQTLLQPESR